ncbi:MAG: outer membrane protein assembly factor BamD [Bacteroidetes bacterium]|nr:outer membrane protein assembly factor BamD [Bacteroidota bacterium]
MAFFSMFSSSRNVILPLLASALLASSCGSGNAQLLKSGTTEERFKAGMKALDNEDYQEAQQFFNAIILQDPASDYADDAQFYLAESYYRNGDYKLAAYNYNRLRTSFPNSSFQREAFFRSGESYYRSSPTYDRDQRETTYAIDVYKAFISIYPNDSLSAIAASRVGELQEKLAQKEYMTADLYMKMENYKSAVMYFDRLIEDYPNTRFARLAAARKEAAQVRLKELLQASSTPK